MKGTMKWLMMAVVVSAPVFPASGQEPSRRGGTDPMSVDRAAARALQLAEELELSEEQQAALRGVRADALTALETLERERLDLRQELRARWRQEDMAERTLEEMRALRDEQRSRMESFRERERELTGPLLERYQGVLGAEQRLELQELQRDRRARARRGFEARSRMNRSRGEFRDRAGGRAGRWGPAAGTRRSGRGWRGR